MSIPEKQIPVPTATLDVSVQYKGEFLNNCTVDFHADGFTTGAVPLGDNGRKSIILSQTTKDLKLQLVRIPKVPQDDISKYPALGGDFPFGPVTGNACVLIIVAEPNP